MKSSMAESNLKIIDELKKFLEDISSDPIRREAYVFNPQDFTRKRLLTFKTVVLLLINTLKSSLSIELHNFFALLFDKPSCSKQAFSKQRRKLKPKFFHDWNHKLTESFYREYKEKSLCWKGFKLCAIDGSSVGLPDTEELRSVYGCAANQTQRTRPVARICVLYDVLNQIALKGLLHHYRLCEDDFVLTVLEDQDLSEKVLLFDRGYLSYWLIYMLIKQNSYFVIRASSKANNLVKSFMESQQTDVVVDFYPPCSSFNKLCALGETISRKTPVKIRLVKIMLNTGETEVLVTNLYDSGIYPLKDMGEVYALRWGIETYYGYMKEELQLGQFSGISPACIEQDFAASLFLFNLQSIIEKQCEPKIQKTNKEKKYTYKVNKNISWSFLKYRVVKIFLEEKPTNILTELERLFCRHLEPVRPGRKYPRLKKRRPNAKHYTLTNYKRAI